jgi:hypothetical protein
MTLREARAVNWPFRGINQPIGDALDAGLISLRDLGWALQGTQGRVQTAARTILFTHVAGIEPATLPRPLRIISGSRYVERQERRALALAIIAASAGLLICAVLVIGSVVNWWFDTGAAGWVALVVLVPLASYLVGFMDRMSEITRSYRMGRWGEERVLEHMRGLLDDRWTLFRNFTWPQGKGGDIDMILVGPSGIWAFEVKTYSGDVRNVGDRWQRRGKWRWHRLSHHPGKQARREAARLQSFLEQIGINYVQPVVLWASSASDAFEVVGTLQVERPKTPVWSMKDLPDRLERIVHEEPSLAMDTVNQIVQLLGSTVAESRRAELVSERPSRPPSAKAKSR